MTRIIVILRSHASKTCKLHVSFNGLNTSKEILRAHHHENLSVFGA